MVECMGSEKFHKLKERKGSQGRVSFISHGWLLICAESA